MLKPNGTIGLGTTYESILKFASEKYNNTLKKKYNKHRANLGKTVKDVR